MQGTLGMMEAQYLDRVVFIRLQMSIKFISLDPYNWCILLPIT